MKLRRIETRGRSAGMTLIEVLLGVVIMSMLLGALGVVTVRGSSASRSSMSASELDSEARRLLDAISTELIQAGRLGLAPEPLAPWGSPELAYQRNVGFAANNVVWGSTERIRFEYEPSEADDGADNNGNGLVDEGLIVWTRDPGLVSQRNRVLGRWVREYLEGEVPNGVDDNGNGLLDERGLSFEVQGDVLTIRLSLERADAEGRLLTRTVQTSVNIRN